jgi:hypothetical protein
MKKLKISLLFSMLLMLFTNLVKADPTLPDPGLSVKTLITRMDDGTSIGGTVTVNLSKKLSVYSTSCGSQTLYNGSTGSYSSDLTPNQFNITINAMGYTLTSTNYALPATTSSSAEIITFDLGTSSIIVSIYKSVSSPAQYVLSAVQGPPLH